MFMLMLLMLLLLLFFLLLLMFFLLLLLLMLLLLFCWVCFVNLGTRIPSSDSMSGKQGTRKQG